MPDENQGRVVILGGGVAGLSAAHELAERHFAVRVFEQRDVPGGKARSTKVPRSAEGARKPLPGEHGFRFFPGFYWHLPDTMRRIPSRGKKSVFEHLEAVDTMTFAFDAAPAYAIPAHRPRSWADFELVLRYVAALGDMGISSDDLVFIWWRLWQIITTCTDRRIATLEHESWWNYVDASNRSEAFQHLLVIGVTRNLVASKAEKANARTVGQVGIQLLLDLVTGAHPTDRILDGPTNDVWIDPWVEHLEKTLKVEYRLGWELDRVEVDPVAKKVTRVVVRKALTRHLEPDVATEANAASDHPGRFGREERHARWREHAAARRAANAALAREVRAEAPSTETLTLEAEHFVFALPVEVMAALLEKQPELVKLDPKLAGVVEIGKNQVEWMNGIQFYLTADVPIARGHINHVDTPWALTSISQSQFWPDFPNAEYADGKVRTILSVDISAWDIPSPSGKEARDCDYREVAEETWRQLKQSLNRDQVVLSDDMLHPTTPWHIDDDIVERVRKERLLARRERLHRAEKKRAQGNPDEPDLLTNAEPLLVNLVDSWDLRPEATTAISNLYLASDYLKTNTNLATMEAANEAARAATNAILAAAHSNATPCHIQPLVEPFAGLRARDTERFRRKLPAKNPWYSDALAFVVLFFGVAGLKVLAWLASVPRTLWLLGAVVAGLLFGFAQIWDQTWAFAFHGACRVATHLNVDSAACLYAVPAPTPAARAQFWYAAYLVIFGVSLYFMPKKTLGALGFPDEYGPWIPILGATPLLMATFYATAALFNVTLFFWFSVAGRIVVFLSVLYLTEGRHKGSPLLLMVAAPEAASAIWSGMSLATDAAAGRFFCLGVLNLVGAFAFQFFPEGTLRSLGLPVKGAAWVPMAAIVLWFWGLYSALAVAFHQRALIGAGLVCQALFAVLCFIAPMLYRVRSGPLGGLRLSLVGVLYGAGAWWLWGALTMPR
ncbi:MAG TPA: FAD-dependent oxidoreductase [Polyangiaceae bacterium]|nr:FAD-dependent oxidoreductase [Polyangiaceae bacterium]